MALGDYRLCNVCHVKPALRDRLTCNVHTGQMPHVRSPGAFTPAPEREPTWDQTWLECAHVMAKRSRCSRAQVGAVVVAEDQTVISMCYNGPPRDFPTTQGDCSEWCPRSQGTDDPSPTYDDCPSVHAEANAIARADFSRMKNSTVYVSTSCCKGCAKLLANSGVRRVVFQSEAGRDYRNPQATIDFLRECGIEVSEV